MPTVRKPDITLTTVDDNVTVLVSCEVEFSQFERRLVGLGLTFREYAAVIGVDPSNGTNGTTLHFFPSRPVPVTDGAGPQVLTREWTKTFPRSAMQEDPAPGDHDEIRGRIRFRAIGIPPEMTPDAWTDQEILRG